MDNVSPHLVMGTASQCIEKIEYYEQELGIDYLTIRLGLADEKSFDARMDQIARFEEVVAYFHGRDQAPIDHPAIPAGARW